MFTQDYLSLRLNRLKRPEHWNSPGDGLAFVFPSAGTGEFVSNSTRHRLSPGDVLVLDCNAVGTIAATDAKEVVFWCFRARLEHLYPLFADDEICLLQDLQDTLKVPRLYCASTPVAAECHRLVSTAPPQFNLDHRSHLLMVAAVVLSAELANARPHRTGFVRIEDHLKNVFETLSVDDILGLSVDELAQRFSCSRRHLNRLFHQHLGLSVSALRMEMRLLKAATLLRDSSAKVINVAADCGFNHLGLFNICFKRRFGASPGQWRKHSDHSSAPSNKSDGTSAAPADLPPCSKNAAGNGETAALRERSRKSSAGGRSGGKGKATPPPPIVEDLNVHVSGVKFRLRA